MNTYPGLSADPLSPIGWNVCDTKVGLHTIRTTRRLGNKVGGRGICALYVNKAFGAYCLIAAASLIDIWGVILEG